MGAIAVTDRSWFDYQRSHAYIDDVNFWTPSDWNPTRLQSGDFFIFKLKGSGDIIGGYGTFVKYKYQSLEHTWNEFGRKNGFNNKEDFIATLTSFPTCRGNTCGCIILKDVVYFDDHEQKSRQQLGIKKSPGQRYSYVDEFPFLNLQPPTSNYSLVLPTEKEKKMQSITQRVGQGEFHTAVSKAYKNACCVTGETIPELLQAAHIQDYYNKNSNHIQNGLLLRIDIHKLFDSGLLYIEETNRDEAEFIVRLSSLVKSELYQQLDGKRISLPDNRADWPSSAALQLKANSFRK